MALINSKNGEREDIGEFYIQMKGNHVIKVGESLLNVHLKNY